MEPKCYIGFLLSVFLLLYSQRNLARAAQNQFYEISEICKGNHKKQHSRQIEGAVITSRGEMNVDCAITFQTDTVLQRFMLRFDKLQLDCNDHLYIYDGQYTTKEHKNDLSCRNTLQNVGTIFTHSNHVTFRYVTDRWGPATNGFKLLITAFKDQKHSCLNFRCKKTNFCVNRDLTCDGVNHCGDRSDESPTLAMCPSPPLEDILGMPGTLLGLVVGSVLLLCCASAITIFACIYRRNRQRMAAQNYQNQSGVNMTSTFGTNGNYSALQSGAPQHTVIGNIGSNSVNRVRPACGVGYSLRQLRHLPIDHCWLLEA